VFLFCVGGLQKLTFLNLNGNQLHTLPCEINRWSFLCTIWKIFLINVLHQNPNSAFYTHIIGLPQLILQTWSGVKCRHVKYVLCYFPLSSALNDRNGNVIQIKSLKSALCILPLFCSLRSTVCIINIFNIFRF